MSADPPPTPQGPSAGPPGSLQGPPPPAKPPRGSLRVRDMLMALAVLLVVVAVGGGVRSCSFAPAGPTVDPDAAPTVDAPARLAEFARVSEFPLRVPAVPPGWRSNSTDRSPVDGGGTAVRVGYLTPEGKYLRLVQSDGTEEALVATEAGGPLAGTGVTDAAGVRWVTYQADGGEPFRVATAPDNPQVQWLITGSGTEADFAALAQATVNGQVLPAGDEQN
ncbi:DUF4245 domain-containing protein [Pseudonocardia sp. RS010]|uniref:DUF4245 domain-containing protein n=1 Tax=Pseudonocardia sp. RS010 TaxID=3385979 RepID=UPI0039A31594